MIPVVVVPHGALALALFLSVLVLAGVVLLAVVEGVGWTESRREVRYLRGRLRAYRGSGRGDYELARTDDHRGARRG